MDTGIDLARAIHRGLAVLLRHRRASLLFFACVMTLSVGGALLLPRKYESTGKLYVRVGRESIGLDPTTTTGSGQTISVYQSREGEIASVVDVLESRIVFEKTVARVGATTILNIANTSKAARDQAIRTLQQNTSIGNTKNSSVISVTVQARAPELAQRLVAAYLDAFQEEHMRVNRTAGSHQFFATQTTMLKQELDAAQEKLSNSKSDHQIVTIDGRRKSLEDQLNTLSSGIMKTEAEIATASGKIAALEKTLTTLPERLVAQETDGFANQAVDMLRQRLNDLKIEESRLRIKYGSLYPKLRLTRDQITDIEQLIANQQDDRTQSTTSANPAWLQLQQLMHAEEAKLGSLKALQEKQQAQQDRMRTELRELNRNEGMIASLQQDVSLLQQRYASYSEKLEQTRIDSVLAKERISNVNIVQPATLVPKPVSPNRRLIVALGLFVALVGALGLPFVLEFVIPIVTYRPKLDVPLTKPVRA